MIDTYELTGVSQKVATKSPNSISMSRFLLYSFVLIDQTLPLKNLQKDVTSHDATQVFIMMF